METVASGIVKLYLLLLLVEKNRVQQTDVVFICVYIINLSVRQCCWWCVCLTSNVFVSLSRSFLLIVFIQYLVKLRFWHVFEQIRKRGILWSARFGPWTISRENIVSNGHSDYKNQSIKKQLVSVVPGNGTESINIDSLTGSTVLHSFHLFLTTK